MEWAGKEGVNLIWLLLAMLFIVIWWMYPYAKDYFNQWRDKFDE